MQFRVLLVRGMDELSDEQVVQMVQSGNTQQYGVLILRYEMKLKRYAMRFLNSPDDIEDLVQDVFIKAYTNIQSFDTTLRFSPWLYRIAHNTYANYLRSTARYGGSLFDIDTLIPVLAAPETADSTALSVELQQHIDTLLVQLAPKYREVLVLHYLEDLSYQEISDVLKIPPTTVGVRLNRARQKLQELYVQNTHA